MTIGSELLQQPSWVRADGKNDMNINLVADAHVMSQMILT